MDDARQKLKSGFVTGFLFVVLFQGGLPDFGSVKLHRTR